MHLVARVAEPSDFPSMMRLCRPDSEDAASNRREWDTLWESEGTFGVVVEDIVQRHGDRVRALMVATVISDAYLTLLTEAVEPYVLTRIHRDPSGLVQPDAFGKLNAGQGMNLLIAYLGWEGTLYQQEPAPNLRAIVVNAFADRHGGNRLKWLLGEVGGPALLDLTTRSGGRILNDYEAWAAENGFLDAPKRPYLMGVSRESAMQNENQWLTRMFTYFPPVFNFTELQRQILVLAREGHTDSEVGEILGVSADAVKKRWSGIYDRVADVFPHLLPESPLGGRGAEKRRALIAHLRERPEELRGFDLSP